jgi:hypothetical protein
MIDTWTEREYDECYKRQFKQVGLYKYGVEEWTERTLEYYFEEKPVDRFHRSTFKRADILFREREFFMRAEREYHIRTHEIRKDNTIWYVVRRHGKIIAQKRIGIIYKQRFWKKRRDGIRQRYWKKIKRMYV